MQNKSNLSMLLSTSVWVAALGYFVDIYDLILFTVVRTQSLQDLGITGKALSEEGMLPLHTQMIGMLLGGLIWGILGDKKGRLSVLFGSILLYSLANIANGFVTNLTQYAVLRFIAGIGLAGELGAGITLVAEILPKQVRGYGTTLVGAVGMLGAVVAYLTSTIFDWRTCYFIGGGLGLMLLVLRISVFESGIFQETQKSGAERGNFFRLFSTFSRTRKYLACLLIGLPTWYVIGILIALSPEFSEALGFPARAVAGKAVMFSYLGISLGDVFTGLVSQWLASRKKVVGLCLVFALGAISFFLLAPLKSMEMFYFACFLLGFSMGYWALFVTIAAEQFGTNMRATVATTAPNFVRGALVPLAMIFQSLRESYGLVGSAWIVGLSTLLITAVALSFLEETFSRDLNYID